MKEEACSNNQIIQKVLPVSSEPVARQRQKVTLCFFFCISSLTFLPEFSLQNISHGDKTYHSSIIRYSQNVVTSQTSINRWLDK